MTKDDIIRMAREAGWSDWEIVGMKKELKRFFHLAYTAGASAEREECAKVVETSPSYDWHRFACEAAAAIRSRKQQP